MPLFESVGWNGPSFRLTLEYGQILIVLSHFAALSREFLPFLLLPVTEQSGRRLRECRRE
jgi:hypothetical protein